jgi:ubiquinone/menaquinone biosynthesis C-methylase UbiE
MSRTDVYGITDQLDDATLQVVVDRLEARAKHPQFAAMLDQYLNVMNIDAAAMVADVGCGAGVAARTIARRPGFRGKITAVDLSPYLVRAGERFARQEGVAERIAYLVGDTQRLKLADATFDAAVAHTLLSHVEQPLSVLQELHRIVKPGGLIGIFDGDYASITFGHEDAAANERYDRIVRAAIITNAMVMRQLPRLLKQARLEVVAFFPHVIAEAGAAEYWSTSIQSFRRLLPKSGQLSEQEAGEWADAMARNSERGEFFGACNFYTYVVRRVH